MFTNIGKKIKTLAKVICWIGIALSILGGGAMIIGGIASMRYSAGAGMAAVIGGVAVMLLGSLFSWLGSFMMIGYGEIVDKVGVIAENTRPGSEYPQY